MDFLLSSDLVDFQKVLQQYFASEISSAFLRERLLQNEAGELKEREVFDTEEWKHWRKLAELGALLVAIPEDAGGLGMGALGAQVVLEASAASLVPLPIFETLSFGVLPLISLPASATVQQLLTKVAEDSLMLSGGFEELFDEVISAEASCDAAGQWTLSGSFRSIPNAHRVSGILLPAKTPDGLALFLAEREGIATSLRPQQTMDVLRPYYRLAAKDCAVSFVGALSEDALGRCKSAILASVSAELLGLGARVLAMTVDYVKTRQQYGKAIGSFQAIQHKLADMCVQQETSSALTRFAAWTVDHDPQQRTQACSASKAYTSDCVPQLIESAIQAHGGIGFTFEYDLHFYLRRAKTLSALFGGREQHYQQVANLFS